MKCLVAAAVAMVWTSAASATTFYETAKPADTNVSVTGPQSQLSITVTYDLPNPVVLVGLDTLVVDVAFPSPVEVDPLAEALLGDIDPALYSYDSRGHLNGMLITGDGLHYANGELSGLTEYFETTVYNLGDPPAFPFSGEITTVVGVPEPATWMLMLIGFGLVGVATRRHCSTVQAVAEL